MINVDTYKRSGVLGFWGFGVLAGPTVARRMLGSRKEVGGEEDAGRLSQVLTPGGRRARGRVRERLGHRDGRRFS